MKANEKQEMQEQNYALYILKSALRDELTYQQQASQVVFGDEGQHYKGSADAFRESLAIANERIPQLQEAIEKINTCKT